MKTPKRALLIDPFDNVTEITVASLEDMQAAVGGYIEGVQLKDGFMYCNEEGKLTGLPANRIATQLAQTLPYDIIVGSVIVFGNGDANGNDTHVTKACIARTKTIAARYGITLSV